MQKFKYIIILALVVVLTLLYLQLDDYDNISNSLLDDNIKANETIKSLQEEISTLKHINENLQEEIVFLFNKIENLTLEIEYLEHDNLQEKNETLENAPIDDVLNEAMGIDGTTPTITLENENNITGFGEPNND